MNKQQERLAEQLELEAEDLERVGYSSTEAYEDVACKACRLNEFEVADFFFKQADLCNPNRRSRWVPLAARRDDAVCEAPVRFGETL